MDSVKLCPPEATLAVLGKALQDERDALLRQDIMALADAGSTKLAALHRLNSVFSEAALSGHVEELRKLAELNHANGALIARRCREIGWAFQQLTAMEASSTYDACGNMDSRIGRVSQGRALSSPTRDIKK